VNSMRVCDRSGCPAFSLHELVRYGQDFHFCHHHWMELAPELRLAPGRPAAEPAGQLAPRHLVSATEGSAEHRR
jgi:hypothetical protein